MMVKANESDRARIVEILAKSFDDNKSINYVVKHTNNKPKRLKRVRGLMEYSFDVCMSFGEVFISEDKNACVLIQLPHLKKFKFKSIGWDAKLGINTIGLLRAIKVLGREGKVKANHPKEPFAYLWFIGVDPENQKKGHGSKLLGEVIGKYEKEGLDIYLETSTLTNIPWYKKHGFETFKELQFSYNLYMMKRRVKE